MGAIDEIRKKAWGTRVKGAVNEDHRVVYLSTAEESVGRLEATHSDLSGRYDALRRDWQTLIDEKRRLECKLEQANAQIEAGHKISGSFFEALKPLNLPAIDVANPGRHVSDLIKQLEQAREALKIALSVINGLAEQQAIPDDWYKSRLAIIGAALAALTPVEDTKQATGAD